MSKEVRIALLAIFSIAILLLGYKFIIGKSVLAKKQYFKVKYKNIDNHSIKVFWIDKDTHILYNLCIKSVDQEE